MARSSQYGSFVATTNVWDVSQILQVDVNTPEFKQLLVRLYQNINDIVNILNKKDTGMYNNAFEIVNGQLWFSNPNNNSSTAANPSLRQVFRTVVNFGALPNTGTTSVPHNITVTAATTFTRIYGTSSDTTDLDYIPLPYASASGTTNVELYVDNTNVNIITASDRSSFNITYIILEYIQS